MAFSRLLAVQADKPLLISWLRTDLRFSCVQKMARLGGFEPPTARFVAEYSIQLSYKRGI